MAPKCLMETSLRESPQRKSLLLPTKGGATLGNQYLQLFLLLGNDRVALTLASGFPKVPAMYISGQGASRAVVSKSIDGPLPMGTGSPADFSGECRTCERLPIWGQKTCHLWLYNLYQIIWRLLWCRATRIVNRIVPTSIYRAKVATHSMVARNQARDEHRKSIGHEIREENSRWC